MQSLASDFATTFVDDATALISGGARIIVQAVMAPIERLANASDVAGVLPARGAAFPMQRHDKARPAGRQRRKSDSRHSQRRKCVLFGFLSHLT